MRKHEVIEIDGKKITVSELRVKDILSLFQGEDGKLGSVKVSEIISRAKDAIPLAVACSTEELSEFAPSELEEVWEAFKRVNAVFFKVVDGLGLAGVLNDLKDSAVRIFSSLYFSLLSEATDRVSGNTDTASS
jgi:hypothetical protein